MSQAICRSRLPWLLLAGLWSTAVHADDDIRWNGFLNVVGGIAREDSYSLDNPHGTFIHDEAFGKRFSVDHDTSAGLQAIKPLDDHTHITAQLYAAGGDHDFQAQMKWLHLTRTLSEHDKLRVGKMGTPIYYFSDYMNVGYAYHWVTPPDWTYAYDTTFTGLDYIHQDHWRGMDWSFEAIYGSQKQALPSIDTDLEAHDLFGGVLTLQPLEDLTLRASAFRETANFRMQTISSESLLNDSLDFILANPEKFPDLQTLVTNNRKQIVTAFKPQVGVALEMQNKHGHYVEFATRYERPSWLLMAEYTQFNTDTYLYNDTKTWFVTGGIKRDKVFYHLTYEQLDASLCDLAKSDYQFTDRDPASVAPAELASFMPRLIRVNTAFLFAGRFEDLTAGVSVETSAHSQLKVEMTWIEQHGIKARDTAGDGSNWLLRTALNMSF